MAATDRAIGLVGGLAGAAGIAASAAGMHAYADSHLGLAGQMLIMHAAALLALAGPLPGSRRVARAAALVMIVGLALFCGDIAMRAIAERPLFPFAAPYGGSILILAWIVAAAGFLFGRGTD